MMDSKNIIGNYNTLIGQCMESIQIYRRMGKSKDSAEIMNEKYMINNLRETKKMMEKIVNP